MNDFYLSLIFLAGCAVTVIFISAWRCRQSLMKGRGDIALQTEDAISMPLTGSMVLFSGYVLLRFIPKEYVSMMLSFYLSIVSIFALHQFFKGYVKPNVLTGLVCVFTGAAYLLTHNWVMNNVLAFSIGVAALENIPVNSFCTSYVLLIGLFFYDIFWVFGSDVMLTVASGVDGPIKFVFPRTIFGDHTNKSLLGLGDVIVPGFFICQTLVFSKDHVKRGSVYFTAAVAAYALSLANTMAVMVIFQHGQPALLFIVPWLLVTFTLMLIYYGDVKAAWDFVILDTFVTPSEEKPTDDSHRQEEEQTISKMIGDAFLDLFGLQKSDDCASKDTATNAKEKKEA